MHNARARGRHSHPPTSKNATCQDHFSIIITNIILGFYRQVWEEILTLLLPSCVVWGQMLRLSGPQSLVKLGCTGWCELKKIFFPPWFDSTSIPHTVVNPLVMPGTQWFPE